MKKIFLIISAILLSCNNNKPALKTTVEANDNIRYEPIFLNLSPRMTDSIFESKLKVNQEINKKKEFLLPIGSKDENIGFKVSKKDKRILLTYEFSTKIRLEMLDKNLSRHWSEKNSNLINNFINLFEKRYKPILTDSFPYRPSENGTFNHRSGSIIYGVKEKSLYDYGFKKNSYKIFQDSTKTILIGYQSTTPYPKENFSFERPMSTAAVSLEINYMHNSDFSDLKNQIIYDKISFDKALKKYDSLKLSKQKLGRENLNKI